MEREASDSVIKSASGHQRIDASGFALCRDTCAGTHIHTAIGQK